MVCAPSNAAIDEIIKRVLENGLISENGDLIRPKIVRVGVLDHTSCQEIIDISLENQANRIFCVNKDQDILETK
jgi:senataxin